MKTTRSGEDMRLRELLRRGDPAHDARSLGTQDLARLRQEILGPAAARGPATGLVNWRWAAVATCVVIVVAMGWHLRDQSVHPSAVPDPATEQASSTLDRVTPQEISPPWVADAVPAPVVPAATAASGADQTRTLRFTTRRGTQIIWTLDPELEL